MHDAFSDASRRAFLRTGLAATALTSLPTAKGQSQTPTTIPAPVLTAPVNAPSAMERIGTASAGDAAILRFSIANEMIGGDLWSQYANQVLYNPAFTAALRAIDPMLPRYILETYRDELSHGMFLMALGSALGVEPVNLDSFRTLPDPGQPALTAVGQTITDPELSNALAGIRAVGTLPAAGAGRLVNLTQLNLDTSFVNKYRAAINPDVQPEAAALLALPNQSTIPQQAQTGSGGTGGTGGTSGGAQQATANLAVMHMAGNEQMEGSTYTALGGLLQNRELLRLMASIMPVEMMHYTVFATSLAKTQGGPVGMGTGSAAINLPDFRAQAAQIPLPILPAPAPVYDGLPLVSVIRPTTLPRAGAVATVQKLTAMNLFAGQPPAFFTAMMQLAQAADAAGTVAAIGPRNVQTNVNEVALSTVGSTSGNGALTYSLRPVQGSAAVIGGDTPTPRVQFQGGYGYYTFELTVTDAAGNTARDLTTVFYTGQ